MTGFIIIQVALGGALGAVLKFLISSTIMRFVTSGFLFGTLLANIMRSAFVELKTVFFVDKLGERFASLLTAGLLGGFTTFSIFSLSTIILLEKGSYVNAFCYVFFLILLSLFSLFIFMLIGR